MKDTACIPGTMLNEQLTLLQGIPVGAVAPDDDDGQHAARGGQSGPPALSHDFR